MHVSARFKNMALCLLLGAGSTVAAEAQQIFPYLAPGAAPYPYTYQYYNGFYGYYPNVPYPMPGPPAGMYPPGQPVPRPFYVNPPSGLVPQPYPYYYQPPLYEPRLYAWPYYPTRPTPPYSYYQPPWPYIRPRRQPQRPYGDATARPRQNVAPVGEETTDYLGPER